MNVLFIRPALVETERRHPQNVTPSLFIGYSASLLEAHGHKTFVFDGELEKLEIDNIKGFCEKEKIETVIFEVIATNLERSLEMARELRKLCKKMVVLGAQASAMPETVVFRGSPFDICIIGEPEKTLLEVISSENRKVIPGTALFDKKLIINKGRELIENLNSLPFPLHTTNEGYGKFYPIKDISKIRFGFVMGSRGCPYSCIYCSPTLRVSFGKKIRKRAPENIVDEIEYLIKNGMNALLFIDDLFTADRKWVISICNEIIRRQIEIPWAVQTRIDLVDEEMLQKMKRAGCTTFCVGIESGNDRVLRVLKKDMTKKKIIESFKVLKNMGFLVSAYFMIGNPTETPDEALETLELAKKLNPDMIQAAFFTPYPGSKAFKEIDREMYQYSHYNETIHNPSNMSDEELKKLHIKFYKDFYLRPGFMIQFISKRLARIISNPKQEIGFIKSALLFLNKR